MTEDVPIDVSGQTPEPGKPLNADAMSYPYRYSKETYDAPETAAVTEFERTPEGYLEIEWQYREVQRALALDFDIWTASSLSRGELEARTQPHIDNMNQKRSQVSAEPLQPQKLKGRFLAHLLRPKWQEHFPKKADEDSMREWENFKSEYPEHIQFHLDDLYELDGKMRVLSADTELQASVQEIHEEKLEVMRAASAYIGGDTKLDMLSRRIALTYQIAAASDRPLTKGEIARLDQLQLQRVHIEENRGRLITTEKMKDELKAELRRRTDIKRAQEFRRGIVVTDSMKKVIDEALPSLCQGRPALLIGDTGGAKTALAEHISKVYFGKKIEGKRLEPEIISGSNDLNVYQLMGKMSLESKDGVTVSEFMPGPVIRAMEEGKPLILDEINAVPPELIKRLNIIMQLRPGKVFKVQEDSGREVTVKPGFVVICTANEKSKRYKGIEDLSVEFQNRFGANVYRIEYPDSDVVYGQPPIENSIVARAALTDRSGNLVGNFEPATGNKQGELERFVRACHVTQQVFSGNYGRGFRDFRSTEQTADGKPGLEEAVLAPRTMVDLLLKVRDSHGALTLEQVLLRYISGIKNENDRKQMVSILKSYELIGETEPSPAPAETPEE